MRETAPFKCDYCLERKGQTNHWWMRDVLAGTARVFRLIQWDDELADKRVTADGLPTTDPDGRYVFEHICSESCASKALSKHMAKVSQPAKGLRAEPFERVETPGGPALVT